MELAVKDGLYIHVPVTVEKDGRYNIALYSSIGDGEFISFSEVKVDGEAVAVNSKAYDSEDLSLDADGNIDYVNANYKMHRFSAYADLSAGEHTITYYAKKRTYYDKNDVNQVADAAEGKTRVTNVVDRIDITKCENTVVYNQENASVYAEVYPESAVSGTAIIALYSGKKLVGLQTADAENTQKISGTVICSEKPETAKILVWGDLNNVVPKMIPIELAVQ